MANPSTESADPAVQESPWRGHAALLVVQLCFGLFPLFAKLAGEGFTPKAMAVWRIAVGSLVLGTLAVVFYGRRAVPARGDLLQIGVLALLGVVLNQVLALEGIALSTSVNAGLMMTLIPVFTFGLAGLVGQERLAPLRAVGLVVALGGALLLQLQGSGAGGGPNVLLGNLLMALNCFSYACFLVMARRFLRRHPPLVVIAWTYVASLWTLPLLGYGQSLWPEGAGDVAWRGLVLLLLFPTVLAYLLNTYALSRVPASVTAIYIYLQPLIAGVAGVALLDEPFEPVMLAAAALMFVGIALVTRRPKAASA